MKKENMIAFVCFSLNLQNAKTFVLFCSTLGQLYTALNSFQIENLSVLQNKLEAKKVWPETNFLHDMLEIPIIKSFFVFKKWKNKFTVKYNRLAWVNKCKSMANSQHCHKADLGVFTFDIQQKKNLRVGITVGHYLIADTKHISLLIIKLSKHNEFHYPGHFFHVFFVLLCHMHLMYSIERNLVLRCNSTEQYITFSETNIPQNKTNKQAVTCCPAHRLKEQASEKVILLPGIMNSKMKECIIFL